MTQVFPFTEIVYTFFYYWPDQFGWGSLFLIFQWISGLFVFILFLRQLSTSKEGITVGGWRIHIFGAIPYFLQWRNIKLCQSRRYWWCWTCFVVQYCVYTYVWAFLYQKSFHIVINIFLSLASRRVFFLNFL